MNLHKLILENNDCYKKGKKITVKGVMVHSTGANNPWLKRYVNPDDGLLGKNSYSNDWNRSGVGACVHAFIGKLADGSIATYQTLPWNYRGWHCASGKNGSGNNTHISFEICEDGLKDSVYFDKVYQEAVELTAMLCKEYNLDPLADGVVICHSEGHKRGIASNHGDVMHWFPKHGKSMDTFRQAVKAALSGETSGNDVVQPEPERVLYRVQVGAYSKKANADAVLAKVKAAGFDTYMVKLGDLYKIQVGAYSKKENADAMLTKLKEAGFSGYVTKNGGTAVAAEPVKEIKVGSLVRVKKGAKTYTGGGLADFVYERNHTVNQIDGDRVVIAFNGVVVAAVHKGNLDVV